jgi:hypothetical protein
MVLVGHVASRAQAWIFDLSDLAWRLRNADEHEVGLETQHMICLANFGRAIHHLYHTCESLPLLCTFRGPTEDVLSKSLCLHECWVYCDRRLPTSCNASGKSAEIEGTALNQRIL